jgi:predicted ATP-grasp superfamily ATP-dependent carboligase
MSKPNALPSAVEVRLAGGSDSSGLHGSSCPSVRVRVANRELRGAHVLVSDEHYKHALGVVRHLGRMGVNVSVVASSKDSLVCRSRYCKEVVLSLAANVDALVAVTLEIVQRQHFDLVMPISFPLTLAIGRLRDLFPAHTALELAASDAIERAGNKVQMTQLAEMIGLAAPKTFVPLSESDLTLRGGELRFPVVIKPKKESPGHAPVRYAKNAEELKHIFSETWKTQGHPETQGFLVQEYIPGYGCGFFATYQRGECKRIFMHRRIREYPASGGSSTCAESFYHHRLEEAGRKILDALHWHGVAMVEFRCDSRDGAFKLIEINPKFWGSLDLALAAGADFPGDLCRMALGQTLSYTAEYNRNLRFHWPLSSSGELYHLWHRPRSFGSIVRDVFNPRVRSNVWLRDFGPHVVELRSLRNTLFGRKQR